MHRFLLACLLAVALLVPRVAGAQTVADPGLFEKSAQAAVQALAVYGPYDDPEELERINRIGYSIARHSGFDKYPFSFFIVDMAVPNAFALPAGHIFVSRGMIELGLDDDMMAGLLGHEIAHVTQEHFLRMRKRATLLNVLSQALAVGAMVGASQLEGDTYVDGWGVRRSSSQTADLLQGAAAAGALATELLLRSYSRENEDESDEEGQRFAAAAGFDPDGTRRLMAKMKERLPQDQTFGYWQTHPFFEERVRAAEARQGYFKVQEPLPVDDYRQRSQRALLASLDGGRLDPEAVALVKEAALAAWPRGPAAESLRLEKLHSGRSAVEARPPLSRDYGTLIAAYEKQLEQVRALTPESSFVARLEGEMEELDRSREALYARAAEILAGGVYETPFLETYLSNFPESEQQAQVALGLGEAYARLARETEAVENLLLAWRSGDVDDEIPQRAARALRVLTPRIERLAALESISQEAIDAELAARAAERLQEQASRFEDLENGAEFLERHPDSTLADTVRARQNRLADELHKEVILYQRVGEHAKAIRGIHRILELAPLSPAAKALGETVVEPS